MNSPRATPDIERVPSAFSAGSANDQRRVALASAALVRSMQAGSVLSPALPRSSRTFVARQWARAVRTAARIDLAISSPGLPAGLGPYVVLPLHESFVDIPMLLHLPIDPVFTVRSELLDHETFGSILSRTGQVDVPESASPATLRHFVARLRSKAADGHDIVVFPQGSVLGIEVAFEVGIVRLARLLDLPVLPVVIAGTHKVWEYPFTTEVRLDCPVAMRVLEPIEAGALDAQSFRSLERRMKRIALNGDVSPRRFDPAEDGWWDDYRFAIDPDFPDIAHAVEAHRAELLRS